MPKMLFSELMTVLGDQIVFVCADGSKDRQICGLSFDCRRSEAGDMFFCKGKGFKSEYLLNAVEKGCVCALYDSECESKAEGVQGLIGVKVKDVRKAMAMCAAHFYGYPMKKLKSVAVTGTKGKSTVCAYVNGALNRESGMKSVLLSSMLPQELSRLTTPESTDIHACAAKAVELGCTHIVCEVSSQAQKEKRTYGIEFDIGCFINFGRDHVSESEHGSVEEYFECKSSLFEQCKTVISNTGDEKGKLIAKRFEKSKRVVSFSLNDKNADFYGYDVKKEGHGCDLSIRYGGKSVTVGTRSLGIFGAENALCAFAVLSELGAENRSVCDGIYLTSVRGRDELIKSADGRVTVVVDYAHNEMSFRAVLENAKSSFSGATITAVFGCPGDKAVCRRAQLAEICARYCDKVIICEDDSGAEGYDNIKEQMRREFSHLGEFASFVTYIKSREQAIALAVKNAGEQEQRSVILVLGKGAEELNRICGCDQRCVSDIELARRQIEKYDRLFIMQGVISNSKRRLAVCTDGTRESAEAIAFCISKIKGGVNVLVVCMRNELSTLQSECFKLGITLFPLSGDETPSNEILGAYLPVMTVTDKEKEFLHAATNFKATDAVYIDVNGGILTGKTGSAEIISLSRARRLLRKRQEVITELAGKGVNVALLYGRQRLSLAAYLCDGGYIGTVIKAE